MNYNDYISSVEPKKELKDITKASVQAAINEQNRLRIRKRNIVLSSAACFVVLAVSVVSFNALNNNTPPIIGESEASLSSNEPKTTKPNSTINNNTTLTTERNSTSQTRKPNNTTNNNTTHTTSENNKINNTTVNTTDSAIQNGKIIINTEIVDSKYGAQKIIVDGNVYLQYCNRGNKQCWGEDNGNVVINGEDIGGEITTIDSNNLVEDGITLSTLDISSAKSNTFYNAKVYQYKKCKNGTVLVVKTKNSYYLFTLKGFVNKTSSGKIIDIYTASGNNPVSKEVLYYKDKKVSTITNSEDIERIINILSMSHTNYNTSEIASKGYIRDDGDYDSLYKIELTFKDKTDLTINVEKHFFDMGLYSKNYYGYYELNKADFEAISAAIGK